MTYQVMTYFHSAELVCMKTETIKKFHKMKYYEILTEIKVIKPTLSYIYIYIYIYLFIYHVTTNTRH